jgi:hypothetical protein
MNDFIELTEYPNYFIAHSPGRLKRVVGGVELICTQTPNSKTDNYWSVTLKTSQGKFVKRNMHRLLMQVFVPNPLNKAHVNHIDGDKSNNSMSNLEWATAKENASHALATGLKTHDWAYKEVHQYCLSGRYLASFANDNSAQLSTGIPKQNISKTTLGHRPHAGYFQWSRIKHAALPKVEKRYIKGYIYRNAEYSTINLLASSINIPNPEKVTLNRLPKTIQHLIEVIYYE